jgi:2-succinyl-6-hydroxy-2,4-cyclohexadiene-1-carboxylate synthase
MLYVNTIPAARSVNENRSTLVFLHGLLGDGEDWHEVIAALTDYNIVTVDLAGHGQSQTIACAGFADCCTLIQRAVLSVLPEDKPQPPLFFIGYSLGARILMYGMTHRGFSQLNIRGSIIEGGNFGLDSAQAKSSRLVNDKAWAERLRCEPIEQVLSDWYRQPVFSSLNPEQRQHLIEKRRHNQGDAVADMLLATSLARQPYLLDSIKQCEVPVHYLCGTQDKKFSALAEQSGLFYTRIDNAGHNAHSEQPYHYAELIRTIVTQIQTRQLE